MREAAVLVTGAGGFVGRALVERLCADGRTVRAATRRAAPAFPAAVDALSGVSLDPAFDWRPALQGVDAVVHLAARVHQVHDTAPDPLAEFRRVNVAATARLAQQAAAAGVRRFIFISSIKVNGESTRPGVPFRADDAPAPVDAYGISKHEGEQVLRGVAAASAMEFTIVRPVLVYGPGVGANFRSLVRWVRRGVPLPLGAVQNQRSLVARDNLVDLIVRCLDHPAAANEVFLVSDGEDLSTPALLRRTAAAMGGSARLVPVPAGLLFMAAAAVGRRSAAARLLGNLQVDIAKTRQLLGWSPPVSVDQALASTVRDL